MATEEVEDQSSLLVFNTDGTVNWEKSQLTEEEKSKVKSALGFWWLSIKSQREMLEDKGYLGIPIKRTQRAHHSVFAGSKVAMEANAGDMAPEFKQWREEHIENDPLVIEHMVSAICPIPDAIRMATGHDLGGNPLSDDEIAISTLTTAGSALGLLDIPGGTGIDEALEHTDDGRALSRLDGAGEIGAIEADVLNVTGGLAQSAIGGMTTRKETRMLREHLTETTGTTIVFGSKKAAGGNYFDPHTNTIHLKSGSRNQPRGMLYEEVQHALDHKFQGDIIEESVTVGNDRLHTGTFKRMTENPLFDLVPSQVQNLLRIGDALWVRGRMQ